MRLFSPRLALRELRGARHRSLSQVSAVAVSVTIVSALLPISHAVRNTVTGSAREWLAADVVAVFRGAPPDLTVLPPNVHTVVIETLSRALSSAVTQPILISIKAVDASAYPYYGELVTEPPARLSVLLSPNSCLVSRSVASRLGLWPDGELRIGSASYRVAGLIVTEPDRIASSRNNYGRVILSHRGLERAHLLDSGTEGWYRVLFKLPPDVDSRAFGLSVEARFPEAETADFHDPDPRSSAMVEIISTFLQWTGWIAVLLGATVAAAGSVLQVLGRMSAIAIMKSLGARNRQIVAVCLFQSGIVVAAGTAIGLPCGWALQHFVCLSFTRYLPVLLRPWWEWKQVAFAAMIATLATLCAAAIPLVRIRRIRPLEMARMHLRKARYRVTLRLPARWVAIRYGCANIGRPGLHSGVAAGALALASLAFGFTESGRQLLDRRLLQSLPVPQSSIFFLGLSKNQLAQVTDVLSHTREVQGAPDVMPLARLSLLRINDVPLTQLNARRALDRRHAIGRTWTVSCSAAARTGLVISTINATALAVRAGDTLQFATAGGPLTLPVTGFQEIDAFENLRFGIVFPCPSFRQVPVIYSAGVRVAPEQESAVRDRLASLFPSLPVITRDELSQAIETATRYAAIGLRLFSVCLAFCAAGAVVLLISISKAARLRELAILKALGARSATVRRAVVAEFTIVGIVACFGGTCLGNLLACLAVSVLFHRGVFEVMVASLFAATLGGALLCAGAAQVSCRRILTDSPLQALRSAE